jgi:hypothetical protein
MDFIPQVVDALVDYCKSIHFRSHAVFTFGGSCLEIQLAGEIGDLQIGKHSVYAPSKRYPTPIFEIRALSARIGQQI